MKIKNILLSVSALLLMIACSTEVPQKLIAVNLVGFQPDDVKQALLVNTYADEFKILRLDTREVVFRDSVGRVRRPDLATGDQVSVLDFSNLKTRGEYIIQVTGRNGETVESGSFRISENIYMQLATTSLQSFYYHRCGTTVKNHNVWGHQECHVDDAEFFSDPTRKIDVAGGWHNAGGYNKFSVNTAFSVGLLLYLYEGNPDAFYDGQTEIPESSNGIPDILDEASWALNWLLKMQDTTGGIYHKVAQTTWNGDILPGEDRFEPRYVFEISSTATADFAAVAAMGARIFAEYDPVLSNKLSEASLKAWEYLEMSPVIQPLGGFVNPPGVEGGEYWDKSDTDERQWAAIELYKLTKDERYLDFFVSRFDPLRGERFPVLGWQNVQILAHHSFLQTDIPAKYNRIKSELLEFLLMNANSALRKQENNNYLNLNSHIEYYYGSNSVGLGYAYELLQIYTITGEERYKKAALDQVHFVLGRNPLGISMVTGTGSYSAQHPYHQLSKMGMYTKPIPGMLVGGPNNSTHLRKYYIYQVISEYPAKNYEDTYQNYLVNEVSINFTAVFLYAVGMNLQPPNI